MSILDSGFIIKARGGDLWLFDGSCAGGSFLSFKQNVLEYDIIMWDDNKKCASTEISHPLWRYLAQA